MTVCVAAYNIWGDLVAVSDTMLSMQGGIFTTDNVAVKATHLSADWAVLYAADDVGVVPGLIRRIQEGIRLSQAVSPTEMAKHVTESFQAERFLRACEQHLGPYGMTWAEACANGENIFGEAGWAVLLERLEKYRLECELLVFGRGGPGQRHRLMWVHDPGTTRDMDVPGYWAIGQGAHLALGSLAVRQQGTLVKTPEMIYNACEAKFAAEAAFGVGCTFRLSSRWVVGVFRK